MFLNGQLWATSDIVTVNQAMAQGFKIVYLGDTLLLEPGYKERFVSGVCLTPDYEALSLQVDGNINGFISLYAASLNSKAAIDMISVILACLRSGTNIMLFLPEESADLNFAQYLLSFIELNFGVTTQTKTSQFAFNPAFTSKVSTLIYLNDMMTAQEFLVNSDTLDEFTIKKLVVELHPMVKNPEDINCIMDWFRKYKDELIKAGRPLINGIQYAGKDSDYGCCL